MNTSNSRCRGPVFFSFLFLSLVCRGEPVARPESVQENQRKEEREAAKYYDKWLNQDVLYIVTDDERSVFEKLTTTEELGVYLQIYNSALDAASNQPAVTIEYTISGGGGKILTQITDKAGNSIDYFSDQRLVLMRKIKLAGLEKETYKLRIKINDTISGKTTAGETEFEVV